MHIHISKKLEKLLKNFTSPKSEESDPSRLGKWNATVFYVGGKKCFFLLNSKTNYCVILVNVVAKDYPRLKDKIVEDLFDQLNFDGISMTKEQLVDLVGEIFLLPTDADRRALGHINYKLDYIYHYLSTETISMDLICHRLNTDLFDTKQGGRYQNITTPIEEMRKMVG